MRLVALLLLLANVAFFGWAQYASLGSIESHLVAQQIRPESIRLLSPGEVAMLGASREAKARPCVEWGAFNRADAVRAQAALGKLATASTVSTRRVEETAGWWVYMPPQASRQAANQKVAELKRLGVDDYFVILEDTKLRFAVSMGVYSTEQAANARLEQLRARGVRRAQVGPRTTPVSKVFLQVRNLAEGLEPKLDQLKEDFPTAEFRPCPTQDGAE
jgi:hypothetical protein